VRRLAVAMGVAAWVAACSDRQQVQSSSAALATTPREHDFGMVGLRGVARAELEVANAGRIAARVVGARIEGAADFAIDGEAPSALASGTVARLLVSFAPSEEGERRATLILETDSADSPVLRVPLWGVGVRAIAVPSTGALDFGRIELGAQRSLPLKLANASGLPVPIRFRPVGPEAAQFSAAGPARVEPGGQATIAVRFRPTAVGPAGAMLELFPCEGCEPIGIVLQGEGIDSALAFVPPALDFGALELDRVARRSTRLRNEGSLPVALSAVQLEAGSDPGYRVEAGPLPELLGPGQEIELLVELAPSHLGPARGRLEARSDSPRRPRIFAALDGVGGGPELGVSPLTLEFGDHAVGSRSVAPLRIQNNGSASTGLEIRAITVSGDPAFSLDAPPTPFTLAAGGQVDLPVQFAPTRPGRVGAVVEIASNDGAAPVAQVALGGAAQLALPCELAVTPLALDFGTLPPGRGAVLGFRVENRGPDLCAVSGFEITDDAGGVFQLGGTPPPGIELRPGRWFVRHVAFLGAPAGQYRGRLGFAVNDPARPRVEIPLSAAVQGSCLELVPGFLDWGLVRGDCGVSPMHFRIVNTCSTPATVSGVALGEGTAPDFEIVSPPALPQQLGPGVALAVDVGYLARVLGESIVPLYVSTPDAARPLLLPLLGESWLTARQEDRFIQQGDRALDVLLVIDNSESMVEEHPRLRAAIPGFVAQARALGLDLHVAVTTTGMDAVAGGRCPGGVGGGEAGRLFPVDGSAPRVLTLAPPGVEALLAGNTQVGTCHYLEKPFDTVRRALSSPLLDAVDDPRTPEPADGNRGFLRDAAALAVVFVSDEDDHSDEDVAGYADFLSELKGPHQAERLTVVAIAPTPSPCATAGGFPGARYAELARLTGGTVQDVCAPDYTAGLRRALELSATPRAAFTLSSVPDGAGVEVTLDGVAVSSGWRYEAATNAIVFEPGSVPPPGTRIGVSYGRECR
jgi:hypothetical protein